MTQELKDKLLKLQETDLVLKDIQLYLDTHPSDTGMLMNFYMQAQKSAMLRNEIETNCQYPLTAQSAAPFGPPFAWIASPWPWNYCDPCKASVDCPADTKKTLLSEEICSEMEETK